MPYKDSDALALQQSRKLARMEKERRAAEDRALRSLFATADGRQFLWWLLEVGKFGVQPFAGQDALTNFQCGEFNVGQRIFGRIVETEPAGYFQMMKDQADNERRANTPTPDASDPASGEPSGSSAE